MKRIALAASIWLATGAPVRAEETPQAGMDALNVQFEDCTEYVGIGLVPFGPARELVPASYTPIEVNGSAILVVRVSECASVRVDGGQARAGRVAQVGINVAGLDASADINNYTLFYVTDSGALAGRLRAAGVSVALDPQLVYDFDADTGSFESVVDAPPEPLVALTGSAVAPDSEPTSFIASWWDDGPRGRVRMRTEFPSIQFSSASVLLTTDVDSGLETLIGGMPYGFALLDSYNAFDTAQMVVSEE